MYLFNKLDSGSYRISIVIPDLVNDQEVEITDLLVGDDNDIDNDIDPEDGVTRRIEISKCTQVPTIDIGLKPISTQQLAETHKSFTRIYPIPAKNRINIRIPIQNNSETLSISILNIQGQVVDQWQAGLSDFDSIYHAERNVSNLNSGLYYLKIVQAYTSEVLPIQIVN